VKGLFASTEFERGVELFKDKNYREAFIIFNKLAEAEDKTEDLDFYLGRSAFESGEYFDAYFAFDRLLIEIDESDKVKLDRVKLELARTQIALGQRERAKSLLNEVLENNPPETVKKRIIALLNQTEEKKVSKKHNFNFFVGMEMGYEENINSNPSVEDLYEYQKGLGLGDPELSEPIDSLYLSEMAGVSYRYSSESGSYGLSSNMFAMNQNYFEDNNYSLAYLHLGVSPFFQKSSNRIEMPIRVGQAFYGGETLLLNSSIGIKASRYIETKFVKAIIFDVFANYKTKSYDQEEDSDLDSTAWEWGLSGKVRYRNNLLTFNYSTEREYAKNEDELRTGFNLTDKIVNNIKVKFEREDVFNFFNLSLQYLLRNIVYDSYEAKSKFYQEEGSGGDMVTLYTSEGARGDIYQSFRVGASKEVIKNLSVDLGYTYVTVKSNHVPAEAEDKSIISLGASYSF
jgi:FimV-like protein